LERRIVHTGHLEELQGQKLCSKNIFTEQYVFGSGMWY
jgi:hypothetical protein